LLRALNRLPGTVRVLVLDLVEAAPSTAAEQASDGDAASLRAAIDQLRAPALVSVAMIAGAAMGEVLALTLGCDLAVAAAGSTFGFQLADIAPSWGTERLVQLLGYRRAVGMYLTGQRLDADAALAAGLLNAVLPPDELLIGVRALIDRLLRLDRDVAAEAKALLLGAVIPAGRPGDLQDVEALAYDRQFRALMQVVAEDEAH
jgi:enoyl-CoA hydratase/carnithine racemase